MPDFSTVWKTFSGFFHTMEKYFPQCGKTEDRDENVPAVIPSLSRDLSGVLPATYKCKAKMFRLRR